MRKVFNAVNVLGSISFLAMIACVGFISGDNYVAGFVSLAVFAGCGLLASKEDGKSDVRN